MVRRRAVDVVVVAAILCSCGPQTEQEAAGREPLEIEDVTLPTDAALSLEEDVKGPRIVEGVSGVLPTDFPRDLPTYEPSSIVNFGQNGSGLFVEFDTGSSSGTVAAELRRRLSQAGWTLDEGGRQWTAERQGRRVRFTLEELRPGTRIRVEYR